MWNSMDVDGVEKLPSNRKWLIHNDERVVKKKRKN